MQTVHFVAVCAPELSAFDEHAQILRLHSGVLQVGDRHQETTGKPGLCSERGEVVARLGLAQQLSDAQGRSQWWGGLLSFLAQGSLSNLAGEIEEREDVQPHMPQTGPSHRAPQTQG